MCEEMGKKYFITHETKWKFSEDLAKWRKVLEVIFFILEYIEKKVSYTSLT